MHARLDLSLKRLSALLPHGRLLPDPVWQRRHRAITLLIWLHVPALALFGLLRGLSWHVLLDVAVPAILAAIASAPFASRATRSIAGSLGLISCSGLLVHFWAGAIEAHFHFFVVVSLLILYQDWVPFLVAIGFVVFHHGVLGTLNPDAVFAHADARQQPWMWAAVHGGFVLAAAAANIVSWRANEQLLRDPLTGLASRLVLEDRIGLALSRLRRSAGGVAVLFIDLDRFKLLNDSLGHGAGDDVLRILADRLRAAVRRSDLGVRFGGDEFVVVCEDVEDRPAAMAIARKLVDGLREPVLAAGRSHVMTASVGVAFTDDPQHEPADLVRDADAAMYRAKELGKDRCELFDREMHMDVRRRVDVEDGLREALLHDHLELEYQPEFDLSSGAICAVEALVRWRHPRRGRIAPAEFIAVAEDSGLILDIGAWVLEEACRRAALWDGAVVVRVNISARQLRDPRLVDLVAEALRVHGLRPSRLCLELTESVLMHDVADSAAVLRRLRALGVTLALDDFGTGYSSLAYLRHLDVDRLKIDRSFTAELVEAPVERTIVGAIVGMARGLGLAVTAEGIETPEQLESVRLLGCDGAQGYLLAKPMSAEEIGELLEAQPRPAPLLTLTERSV